MIIKIEYISIFDVTKKIKEDYPNSSKKDIVVIIRDILMKGVIFKNIHLNIISKNFYNKFSEVNDYKHYFLCPSCQKKVRKIYYIENDKTACRSCCKIKSKTKINSQADRIIKIQKSMHELMSSQNLSTKKKNKIKRIIINNYNSLDDRYKFAYNTFVFKEIQNWCLDTLIDKEKSKDYKKAVKDMLDILRSSKTILIKTNLVKVSKKDLKI